MTSEIPFDPASLIPELRHDLEFSNRQHSGLQFLIEVAAENRYYTIGTDEYRLLGFLDGQLTLREAFDRYRQSSEAASKQNDPQTLTWEQAVELFRFLQSQQLLAAVNGQPTSQRTSALDERRIQNINPYGFRLQLFQADRLAQRLARSWGWFFQPAALIGWLLIVGWAGLLVLGNLDSIIDDTRWVLQSEQWLWLTVCWLVLKVVHEAGHAVSCRASGGKVGQAGIHFLLLLPMPYVDVSSSWTFESKWKRILVALAGIQAELLVAALSVFIWIYQDHAVWDAIAVQIMLMASLSTFLFNLNPLMRFDGYYVLSDLLRRPNLATNGATYLTDLARSMLLGMPAHGHRQTVDGITRVYAWLALVWKIVVAVTLLVAAANLFHGAGIVLAALAILIWYVKPLVSLVIQWFSPAKPTGLNKWRCLMTVCGMALAVGALAWIPWPLAPQAVGVIDYSRPILVRAPSAGFLEQVFVRHGQQVAPGDRLAVLKNPELEFQYRSLCLDRDAAILEARKLKREDKLAAVQATNQKVQKLDEQIHILENQVGRLELIAPTAGIVVASDLPNLTGRFFSQGESLLKIVTPDRLEVQSGIREFDAPLFRESIGQPVVIDCESGITLKGHLAQVHPTAILKVFHPAISAENGGPLAVQAQPISPSEADAESRSSMRLAQPVFIVRTGPLMADARTIGHLKVGQRCRVYLPGKSHSCLETITYELGRWLREKRGQVSFFPAVVGCLWQMPRKQACLSRR